MITERVADQTGEYVIVHLFDADDFAKQTGLAPLAAADARFRVLGWARDPALGRMLRRLVLHSNERGVSLPDVAEKAIEDAFRLRWKVFRLPRVERRAVRIEAMPTHEHVLGPEPINDSEPDVFVLAAEVKLIGDTPLIRHAVRVIDPETGAVVAEDTTDGKGILRTEVPENKHYRIEIVDDDPEVHAWHAVRAPDPVLRCLFVDRAGAPVPHVDAIVKDLDGDAIEVEADEEGLLELPLPLGLYEVVVEGESHWIHSLLHTDDAKDAYEIVVSHGLEDGSDGIDPEGRLARVWDDDDDDDENGVLA